MSTRDHKAAVADGNNLRHEVSMYKSVLIPVENKPRTNITRIVRPALATQSLNIGVPANKYLPVMDEMQCTSITPGEMTLDEIA